MTSRDGSLTDYSSVTARCSAASSIHRHQHSPHAWLIHDFIACPFQFPHYRPLVAFSCILRSFRFVFVLFWYISFVYLFPVNTDGCAAYALTDRFSIRRILYLNRCILFSLLLRYLNNLDFLSQLRSNEFTPYQPHIFLGRFLRASPSVFKTHFQS